MNSFEWPNIWIVAVDRNGNPRCVAEGISCVARNETYNFAVRAMLEMAPGWSSNDEFGEFSNGILCSAVLEDDGIGLQNARFFWVSYHLLYDIWPKKFVGAWPDEFCSGVCGLLHAVSQEDFDYIFDDLIKTFCDKVSILDFWGKYLEIETTLPVKFWMALKELVAKWVMTLLNRTMPVLYLMLVELYMKTRHSISKLCLSTENAWEKRNQEKSEYKFEIGIEVSTLDPNDSLVQAMKQLDRKPVFYGKLITNSLSITSWRETMNYSRESSSTKIFAQSQE